MSDDEIRAYAQERDRIENIREQRREADFRAGQPFKDDAGRDDIQTAAPKPQISPDALYGLLGEITQWIEPETEADPAAIYAQVLVAFGNHIGRCAYFQVEQTKHFPNLFVNLVGRTSRGRKGTSLDYIIQLFAQADPHYRIQTTGGLSTGEGLIWHVRDPIFRSEYDKKTGCSERVQVDDGVSDKRLLVIEAEFARTLHAMARHGNTLSAVMRRAWDSGDLQTLTKNESAKATGAHVSLVGHITEDELRRDLSEGDHFNGFANRFLWIAVSRSKLLPVGGKLDCAVLEQYAERLDDALDKASQVREMRRAPDAQELWRTAYGELTKDNDGMLGLATSRAEAQVLRISMINALTDGSSEIQLRHLQAALAFWEYCFASARKLFGGRVSDPRAQQILDALRRRPEGMTRRQISEEIFGRNLSTDRISNALQLLLDAKLAVARTEATDGRSAERWFTC
jgi:Protein of unknown function (DUF3987)